jgi:hypothetical protein
MQFMMAVTPDGDSNQNVLRNNQKSQSQSLTGPVFLFAQSLMKLKITRRACQVIFVGGIVFKSNSLPIVKFETGLEPLIF